MWRPQWLRHWAWRTVSPHAWVALPNGLMLVGLGAPFLLSDLFELDWRLGWQVTWGTVELTTPLVAGLMTLAGVLLLADAMCAFRRTAVRVIVWQAAFAIEWWIVWHTLVAFLSMENARPLAGFIMSVAAAVGVTVMLWFGPPLVGSSDAGRPVRHNPLPRRPHRTSVPRKRVPHLQESGGDSDDSGD